MELAADGVRAVAVDLPGIGGSAGEYTDGSKTALADVVHSLIHALELEEVTLVGHDVGGMIAYAYARAFDDLARVVIMDVVMPGLDRWDEVLHNPYIWHFAFHSIPELPERLVTGRQADYFDYFFATIAADPSKITSEARSAYVEAYSTRTALTAGFNWYRTFSQDAEANRRSTGVLSTPLLYLRGEFEGGDIDGYVAGLQAMGVADVEKQILPGAGHFAPEEAPEATWRLIADFIGL
jgi:pimeloyl-ACP methyl ester carboxylesterase